MSESKKDNKKKSTTKPQAPAAKIVGKVVELKPKQETPVTAEGLIQVPVGKIHADPAESVRCYKDDPKAITELAESIKRDGVIEPLVVSRAYDKGNESGVYELIAGSRRLKASKEAGLRVVPCIVRKIKDGEEQLRLSLHENLKRRNLSPMEVAHAIHRVRGEMGWTGEPGTKKVAGFMGMSIASITQMEKLLTLPGDVQKAVHERGIGAQAAQDLADILEEYGPEKAEEVITKATKATQEKQERKEAAQTKKAVTKGKGKPAPTKDKGKDEDEELAAPKTKEPKDRKPAKVTQAEVRKAAKESGADLHKAPKLSAFVEIMEVCLETEEPALVEFAKAVIAWSQAKIDDDKLLRKLVEIFKGNKDTGDTGDREVGAAAPAPGSE